MKPEGVGLIPYLLVYYDEGWMEALCRRTSIWLQCDDVLVLKNLESVRQPPTNSHSITHGNQQRDSYTAIQPSTESKTSHVVELAHQYHAGRSIDCSCLQPG